MNMVDIITSILTVVIETIIILVIMIGIIHLVAWLVSWAEQHIILFLVITLPTLAILTKQEIDKY